MNALSGSVGVCGYTSGRYQISVYRSDGTLKRQTGWFDNLITDWGLNAMGDTGNWLTAVQVGTGTVAPQFTDTTLGNRVAGTTSLYSTSSGAQPTAPYYAWRINTWRFTPGQIVGNITEVGVGPTTTGNVFSRALIVDETQTPTSITVLSDEYLDISYEFRYYPPTVDTSGSFVMGAQLYNWIGRACSVTSNSSSGGWSVFDSTGVDAGYYHSFTSYSSTGVYSGTIGTITGVPSGTLGYGSSGSVAAYSSNSLSRTHTRTWGLTAGNIGGIVSFRITMGMGNYQFEVSPAIPKTEFDTLTMTFSHSWARKVI